MERDTPVVENGPIEGASNSQGTQQSLPEENNYSQLEDDRLIARARAVGVDYEFAKPGVVETEDDRRKKSGQAKDEYQNKRKGCEKLLEIYRHLHQRVQVSKKIRRTVLFVHLRWSR